MTIGINSANVGVADTGLVVRVVVARATERVSQIPFRLLRS
ncbi:hypothetical protein [Candidatus Chloroploca mongolica]|nr:hypothetical protein [Candidatus Chloroploca mongolica]